MMRHVFRHTENNDRVLRSGWKTAGVKPLPLIGLGISNILFQRDLVRAFPPLKHRNTEDQFVGLVDTAEIKLVLKRPT